MRPYVPGELKPGAVKLASNENPFGPSPLAVESIRRDAAAVHLYPDQHAHRLRKKLASTYGVGEEQFIIGNGSDEIMTMIAGTYLEDGDNTVTAHGTFSTYTFATLLYGGEVRHVPLKDGRFDLPAIRAAVDERTQIIFVCNPNNPTGTYVSQTEVVEFLQSVPERVLVVMDEAYAEFVEETDYPDSVALISEYPNLIVLRTFSKIYGLAGMRVGYGIASAEVVADISRVKQPFNVGILSQAAAASALADTEFVERSISNNKAGKEYLYAQLTRLGVQYFPTSSNFICIETRKDSLQLFQRIMELGVTIRPLASFGMATSIRVTVGTPEQNELFIRCLEQALGDT
jgi:histidinol-phosphate aminotransferase